MSRAGRVPRPEPAGNRETQEQRLNELRFSWGRPSVPALEPGVELDVPSPKLTEDGFGRPIGRRDDRLIEPSWIALKVFLVLHEVVGLVKNRLLEQDLGSLHVANLHRSRSVLHTDFASRGETARRVSRCAIPDHRVAEWRDDDTSPGAQTELSLSCDRTAQR